MTSRESTALRALREETAPYQPEWSDRLYRMAFGAIGWPWLLRGLWGGTKRSKRKLLERVRLPDDALPNLGSWKADTHFLHCIVDAVEQQRPMTVVELGAGASTLVCARALELNGGGRLLSFDQHAGFVEATTEWLADFGVKAQIHHAPLGIKIRDWPGSWYQLDDLPKSIDLLIIDGPPWAVHPFVRGAAECLFDRLSEGGIVLLDDAARPGERVVARRWAKRWPGIEFKRLRGGTKGTLRGMNRSGKVIAFPERPRNAAASQLRRAAGIAALLATGWLAHEATGTWSAPAQAASFIDEAEASYAASLARQQMNSQIESTLLDRSEITRLVGLNLPNIPQGWKISDVQVYPSDSGNSVAMVLVTGQGELISLYAQRAETPAEQSPLFERREGRTVAYWDEGPFAYALTGELAPARMLLLASQIAGPSTSPSAAKEPA